MEEYDRNLIGKKIWKTMTNVTEKGTINAAADEVWKTLSSFRNVEKYIPLVKSSTVEGSGVGAKRTCIIPNESGGEGKIEEELKSFDNDAKTFSYSITSSPMPLENYLSTVKVKDLGNGRCEVEWSSTFIPKGMPEEEVAKMINDIYVTAIDGLKKLHNG